MKLTRFLPTLILFFQVISTYGQIELEKTFYFPNCTTLVKTFYADSKTFYCILDNESINIFNQDYSLYKQIIRGNSSERFEEVYLLSDNLFNSDNKIEFITKKCSNNECYFVLLDENGDSLTYFGQKKYDGCLWDLPQNFIQCIKTIDNKTKLIVNASNCDSIYIYNLPGALSVSQENLMKSQNLALFPNPTNDFVTITTDLSNKNRTINIFDNNGRIVKVIPYDSGLTKMTLDIKNFKSGVYIYRLDDKTGKFIVK